MNAMLEIKNLHVDVGERKILTGFDLTVKPGEMHAIMGPNGSGKSTLTNVLAGRDGYIVTGGWSTLGRGLPTPEFHARLAGGHELPAEVIGADPNGDFALLRIDPTRLAASKLRLSPLPLGDSDQTRLGEWVLTMGYAAPDGISVSKGIISLTPHPEKGPTGLQIDIELENSFAGAPVIDMNGRVLGVVLERRSKSSPQGKAVPSNLLKEALPKLLAAREPRGWLGVELRPVDPELAKGLGLREPDGALVGSVIDGSPAQRASLRRGDVIVEFAGKPIRVFKELSGQIAQTSPGSEVALVVLRDGSRKQLRAVLERRKIEAAPPPPRPTDFGFQYAELTAEQTWRYSLPAQTRGLAVLGVSSTGPARRAGLQIGDILLEIDRKPVRTLQDARVLDTARDVMLLVQRGERTRFITLSR